VRQGEWGDRLYIIQHGEAEVSVNGRVVRRVGPAGYFGEVALLLDIPRTATVRAVAPTELYSLEKASFQKLMRQAEELEARLASQIETYELYSDRLIPL
jgi:CRP-like cAMP-binding protein